MFGVVLWSNDTSRKAVIWCEDQGDLAYMDLADAMSDAKKAIGPGDLLRIELHNDPEVRRVRHARLIETDHAPDLARKLNIANAATTTDVRTSDPRVIPFPAQGAARKRTAAAVLMTAQA